MVYAFIIHTLLPGQCRVLFYQIFGTDGTEISGNTENYKETKTTPKEKVEFVAAQVSVVDGVLVIRHSFKSYRAPQIRKKI